MNDRDAWIHFACAYAASREYPRGPESAAFADGMMEELKKRERDLDDSPVSVLLESGIDVPIRIAVDSDEQNPIFTFRLDEV
jgi:hypothetical protein